MNQKQFHQLYMNFEKAGLGPMPMKEIDQFYKGWAGPKTDKEIVNQGIRLKSIAPQLY